MAKGIAVAVGVNSVDPGHYQAGAGNSSLAKTMRTTCWSPMPAYEKFVTDPYKSYSLLILKFLNWTR